MRTRNHKLKAFVLGKTSKQTMQQLALKGYRYNTERPEAKPSTPGLLKHGMSYLERGS